MTHTENTKEKPDCERLGHVCSLSENGQRLLECTFCLQPIFLYTKHELEALAEARVREERAKTILECFEVLNRKFMKSSSPLVFDTLEEAQKEILGLLSK